MGSATPGSNDESFLKTGLGCLTRSFCWISGSGVFSVVVACFNGYKGFSAGRPFPISVHNHAH